MSIQQVRILLGDLPKWDRQTATGDGVTKNFVASKLPIITDSETVTVNSVAQTKPTNYSLDADLGLFTFVTAPTSGHAIVSQFAYAELSDETITAVIALEENVRIAAAMCAESLAGKYSSLVDKKVGDLSISYSQRSKSWTELAKKLRAASTQGTIAFAVPKAGGISRAAKDAVDADTDRAQPAFYKGMHEDQSSDIRLSENDAN